MMWLERLLGQRHAHPQEHLSAYIDGALRPAEKQRIEAHLDACPECRTRVEELRAVRASLRALPEPALRRSFRISASDADRIDARRRSSVLWTRSYAYGRVVSAGFAVLLIVLLGVDAFSPRMLATRETATLSQSKATSGGSADSGGSAASESNAAPQQAPAPAPRAVIAPPSATQPAAGSAAFSATPPQAAPTAAEDRATANEAQPQPATPGGSATDSFNPSAPAPVSAWPNLRVLEIMAGVVLVLVAIFTLYVRVRASRI